MDFLISFIKRILQWCVDNLVWLVEKLFDLVLTALAAIINAIPVPTWLSNAGAYISGFLSASPYVNFAISTLHLDFGLQVIVGAYLIRFLIRRIPFFG